MKYLSGWKLIKEAMKAFKKFPELVLPVILSWAIYASIILYIEFYFELSALPRAKKFLFVYLVILVFSLSLCFSCSWLLELIEQIESNKEISLIKSLKDGLRFNLLRVLPIAFVWSIVWFILVILNSRKKNEKDKESFNLKSATLTMAGISESPFSWIKVGLDMLNKLVRMIVFLSLPAICWRNKSSFSGFKESIKVIKLHPAEFLSGYLSTGVVSFVLYLPVLFLIFLDSNGMIEIATFIWPILYLYLSVCWSFSIYIEQMFAAEMYLWHLKWEKAVMAAKAVNKKLPVLQDIPAPSLVDNIFEISEL